MQYLVILLDKTSTAYCHADNPIKEQGLIALEDLRAGIFFAMKENLMVQYVLPDYPLPSNYIEVMNTIDSHIIVSSRCSDGEALDSASVIVFNSWDDIETWTYDTDKAYVLRTKKAELFDKYQFLHIPLSKTNRLNVVLTDLESFDDKDFEQYKNVLSALADLTKNEYTSGHMTQFNLCTDRLMLNKMNNCDAGIENIALAPNGKFYVCPAFYYDEFKGIGKDFLGQDYSIGNLKNGLNIKNQHLYKLAYAPICRKCDAYQCKRCVWLNRTTTHEVNTPSHEQCVVAHLERNVSMLLQKKLEKQRFTFQNQIQTIDYLDPFEKIQK